MNIKLSDMEIVTKRFLLRDFVESDRSSFLDYQADPRSQIFYEPSEASPENSARLLALLQKVIEERISLSIRPQLCRHTKDLVDE